MENTLNKYDFQPDNKFDFQPDEQNLNNKFDFQADDVKPSEETTPMLTGKVEYIYPFDSIHNDKSLSQEEKAQKIQEFGEREQKRIEKEHKIKMAKLYGGAALEIGSAAIPFGGAAKLGGQVALKLAKPAFSEVSKRVIAKNIGSGIASGLASGAMFGTGEGLMQDKNMSGIAEETLKGASEGTLGGGLIGGVAGKLATKIGRTKDVIQKTRKRQPISGSIIEDEVRNLINTRCSNIDSAKFDAVQKINKFISQIDDISKELNVNPKNLREVLTFLRENEGLPTKNLNRPDLENFLRI